MKLARSFAFLVLLAFAPLFAHAATATINWTAPTTAVDSSPLTGVQAITGYQVWLSTSSIPSTTTAAPTATITGTATTTIQTITAAPGATIYARVKACNSAGCSDFSAEGSKVLPANPPGVPTSVTITVTLQ